MIVRHLFTSLIVSCFALHSYAEVVTYNPPSGTIASEWFTMKANDKKVFVYDSKTVAPFAIFDLDGSVILEIESKKDVRWVDIRPKTLGLDYTFSGTSIRVKVTKPCQFSVEINGQHYHEPLMVFANPIEKNKPSAKDTNVLFFETGKLHKAGIIKVKSNKIVYIEGGAVVEGLILAEKAENIQIRGTGILDGKNNRIFFAKSGNNFVGLRDCKNVTLSGITLINTVSWEVVTWHSKDILIDNIHIVSENGGDDGIDIVRTQNLVILNSFVRTKDDNIVVKCLGEYPAKETTENVLVKNCVLWNTVWGNAIEIGFELRSDSVRNIRFEDCDIIHCEAGAAFSIHNTDSAVVTDIVFENIRVEETTQKLFDLSIFLSKFSSDNTFSDEETSARYWHGVWDNAIKLSNDEKKSFVKNRGTINNILFKDIYVTGGPLPFSVIAGYDQLHTISNIRFKNIVVLGQKMTDLKQGRFVTEFADKIVFE